MQGFGGIRHQLWHGLHISAFSRTPAQRLCYISGGVRKPKPVVGRGPWDQSSGAKWCGEAREALACCVTLRFERASRRETGRSWITAFTTELRPETIFRGCSEVVPCFSRTVESMVTFSEKTRCGHLKFFAPLVHYHPNKSDHAPFLGYLYPANSSFVKPKNPNVWDTKIGFKKEPYL